MRDAPLHQARGKRTSGSKFIDDRNATSARTERQGESVPPCTWVARAQSSTCYSSLSFVCVKPAFDVSTFSLHKGKISNTHTNITHTHKHRTQTMITTVHTQSYLVYNLVLIFISVPEVCQAGEYGNYQLPVCISPGNTTVTFYQAEKKCLASRAGTSLYNAEGIFSRLINKIIRNVIIQSCKRCVHGELFFVIFLALCVCFCLSASFPTCVCDLYSSLPHKVRLKARYKKTIKYNHKIWKVFSKQKVYCVSRLCSYS